MKHAPLRGPSLQPDPHPTARGAGQRLRGRRILIPAHRELDRLAGMLANEGATAFRCPLMALVDAPDQDAVDAWVRVLASRRFDLVVFLSAEGVVRLVDVAERLGIKDHFLAALRHTSVVTRGAKPACALYDLGIPVDVRSAMPTAAGIIESLRGRDLTRRHVGLQLFGDDPARELVTFFEGGLAFPHPVAPYRYAPTADDDQVCALIERIGRADLDAIVFTAAPQIERLFEVAERHNARGLLRSGLERLHLAAVGAAVAGCLDRFGVRIDTVPPRPFFMQRLIEALVDRLGTAA
jgi:uroporphyrinogen-III synthase